jgi:cytoskeleton protein RodZ
MPSVGEILAAERRRQGKTLPDVVDGTKIRSRLLDALESGRYEELPSPAYVKGYIQSYARYLEIPAEPLLEQYKLESSSTIRPANPADRYLSEIPVEPIVADRDRQHAIPRNVVVIVAAGLILLVLALCGISRLLGGGSGGANTTPPAPSSTPASASPGTTSSVAATNASNPSVTKTTGSFKLRVTVRTGLASFVKATVDGLTANAGTLQGGDSREWLVTSKATLVIGNPAAVVVTRDGKTIAVPQTPNASISLTVGQ